MCIPWGGTKTLPQACTVVSWLLLLCICIPSLPWLATVRICPVGLREGHGVWSLSPTNKKQGTGLPWWRSGWESACQCRGHGFEPWSGKIPHAAEQLGPWATTTEPVRLELVLHNKRGRDRGLSTAMKSGPRLLQLEKALAQKRRPNTAINK